MGPKTPEEWWELLNSAPNVASPWHEYRTEDQRVNLMMVRRDSKLGRGEVVAIVYGPHFPVGDYQHREEKDRTEWIVAFKQGYENGRGYGVDLKGGFSYCLPGRFTSVAAGMAAADEKLTKDGWLLVK